MLNYYYNKYFCIDLFIVSYCIKATVDDTN